MPTTLTGDVERVTYENEETSFRVIRVGSLDGEHAKRGSIAVVGTFQAVGPGTRVRLTGDFVKDARHGEQFRVSTVVPVLPGTLAGLKKYLGSGAFPGIGPRYAERIVETFGMATLDVLDREPQRLREVRGLGRQRREQIRSAWASQQAVSNVMMLLQTHGASPALAARIHKHYGDKAASVVQRSPYRLALEVRGVGFKTADRIAQSLGIAGDHPERAQAGVVHELGDLADQGHTFAPRPLLVERAAAMLGIDAAHVESAVDALWASGRIVVDNDGVYLSRLHRAEGEVARGLARLLASPGERLTGLERAIHRFEQRSGLKLDDGQTAAVRAAADRKLVVITGGPGVGKTTIIRAVLSVLDQARLRVKLAAPTGRAAKRLSEASRREATTLHRLLEFEPRSMTFQRSAASPLPTDAVIVDEASMIDVPLAAALLEAMPDAARLVIVGDADQLPSVGPGAFLRDLIESGALPTVRLSRIFRQAGESLIVENAHGILRGEMPESASADDPRADFFVVKRQEPEAAAELIRELVVERIPKRFGLDPQREIQVLTPMHRGAAGTIALNALLQAALNPSGPSLEVRGQVLRVHDKIMQTRNDYEKEVFNGDIGSIVAVEKSPRSLRAQFDERIVEYQDADLDALVLAYATSIHKSQGSEYPAVVVPMLTTHFVMLSRNLLYTAVTRARKLCVLVSDKRALGIALAETRREDRMTRLVERIVGAKASI